MNSNSAAPSCSRNGIGRRKPAPGAWCHALRIRFCPAKRFYNWKTSLFRRNCSAIMPRPSATIDIDRGCFEPRVTRTTFLDKNGTSPGEFSVIGTCCGQRRFHGLGGPRYGGGTNRKEEISHGGNASKVYESNLAGRLPAVWRAVSQSFPCRRHCLTHKFLISTFVNNEHQALKRY